MINLPPTIAALHAAKREAEQRPATAPTKADEPTPADDLAERFDAIDWERIFLREVGR